MVRYCTQHAIAVIVLRSFSRLMNRDDRGCSDMLHWSHLASPRVTIYGNGPQQKFRAK